MKKGFLIGIIGIVMLYLGCERKVIVVPPTTTPSPQVEKALPSEKAKALPGEETLQPVKYPGIEGEVWRTPLLKTIYFDFDKYDLRPDARKTLEENAKVLRENPTWKILIEGHCDERGSNEYNLALGERRARAAMEYLVQLGIDPSRLSIVSYGEERPVDPRHCEEAWAQNRRCEFVVVER